VAPYAARTVVPIHFQSIIGMYPSRGQAHLQVRKRLWTTFEGTHPITGRNVVLQAFFFLVARITL
jgi:hypothetical protein